MSFRLLMQTANFRFSVHMHMDTINFVLKILSESDLAYDCD